MSVIAKIQEGQTLLDICLQTTGGFYNLIAIAALNDLSPTGVLSVGTDVVILDEFITDAEILTFYTNKSIKPATAVAITESVIEEPVSCQEKIENQFINDCNE